MTGRPTYYACERIYECEVIPAGCIGRVLIRLLVLRASQVTTHYDVNFYWLDGFIARSDSQLILVQHNANKISVQMRSELRAIKKTVFASPTPDLFCTIISTIDELLESYPSLSFKRLVPCNHCFSRFPNMAPHMFNLANCWNAISTGKFYVCCRDSPAFPVRVDYLAPDLTPSNPPLIREPVKILGEFSENGKTYQYGKTSFADVVIMEVRRKISNPYISFVLSGLKHPNLAEFYGVLEDPTSRASVNSKPTPALKRQSSEIISDYDEDDEGEQYENGVKIKRESFADFVSALGQRVSLKGGITQNMKTLINSVSLPISPVDRRNGSLYRSIEIGIANENETLQVVMENIPNVCNLRNFLQSPAENGDIDLKFKLQICIDVAKGLQFLHNCTPAVVHGTLNSSTVFLMKASDSDSIIARVSDYGIFTSVEPTEATFAWIAPELLRNKGKKPTPESDIYSYGMLVYEIFTEKLPFSEFAGIGYPEIVQKILDEDLRPNCSSFSHDVSFLIQECTLPESKNRPNCEYLVVRLGQMLACLVDSPGENSRKSMRIDKVTPRNFLQFSKSEAQLEIKIATRVQVPSALEIGCMLIDGNSVWVAGSGLCLFDAQACVLRKILAPSEVKTYQLLMTDTFMLQTMENGQIFTWEKRDFKPKEIANDHTGAIKSAICVVVGDEKFIWTGDTSGRIAIWTNEMEKVISFDVPGPVLCMTQHNEWIWIGMNKNICALRINDPNQRVIWRAHGAIVNDIVSINGVNEIWSCSNDGSVCVWAPTEEDFAGQKIIEMNPNHKLEGHLSKVVSIKQISENEVWTSGFEDTILVWNIFTHQCISKVKTAHNDMIRCMLRVKDKVWSGSYDKGTPLCICEL
eukprot:Phypoly_transcript_01892.p1 GENE.Phypoly_transcript_01892~~Phypoly_transcript_01892.p1  ORF type:complete len:993 (+),score=108.21 Phypoly_transcript_01892:385-2979(+)